MKRSILAGAALALAIAAPVLAAKHAAATPKYLSDAIAQSTRPADQTALDAERKPAETLVFAGVKPGSKIMDLVPGRGYFTRLFSGIVGDKGYIYAYLPSETDGYMKKNLPDANLNTLYNGIPHTSTIHAPLSKLVAPESLDIVFTAQNYHDFHDSFYGPADLAVVNKAVYDALKPGGYFIVIDHSAVKGSGLSATETLHRIDEDVVKKEVEAAGFKLVAEANFLRNPTDPRDKLVFDASIRHKTDQFVLKFQKPRK